MCHSSNSKTNLPDIPQKNHKTGIDKFLVELSKHSVSYQYPAENEKRVDEEIAMKEEPSCSASVLLKKTWRNYTLLSIVLLNKQYIL